MVRGDIEEKLADAGINGVTIKGMALHGSRLRGDAREDSDLDVVVEYEGDMSEDGLFNILNDEPMVIEGVRVDVNPITRGKSGTLDQYMARSRQYDALRKAERETDTEPTEAQKEGREVAMASQQTERKGGKILPLSGNEHMLEEETEKSGDDPHIGYSAVLQAGDGTLQRSIFYDGRMIAVQWQPGERLGGMHDILRAAFNEAPAENYDLFVPQQPANDTWEIDGREVIDFDHGDVVRFHSEEEMLDFYRRNREEIDRRIDRQQNSSAPRMQKAGGMAGAMSEEERELGEALDELLGDILGDDYSTDHEEGQRVLDADRERRARMMGSRDSKRRQEREETNRRIDEATAFVTGREVGDVRRERIEREQERKRQAEEIYRKVLSGQIDDVTLQQINDYINDVTPRNPYGRRLSERLPQRVERAMYERARENALDALFSRISESAVRPHERTRASGRRAVEERKKELLKQWAIATGNWHTDLSDFTDSTEPIGSGTDSDVYPSKDGAHVIKFSKGKPQGKRFRPDIDNIPLFNYLFPNSAYRILGYGNFGNGFVRILEQPAIDFSDSTPLTEKERVDYMAGLGFHPINDKKTAFSNGEIIVADLQKSNIVKDAAGNVTVIDADCKLHTRDLGGQYDYLPVEHDLPEEQPMRMQKVQDKRETEKIFDAAKKRFGTTRDLREAGYILPDGTMLDFSGRHQMDEGMDTSGLRGQRSVDHRDVKQLNYESDGNTPSGIETSMPDFIERGAIRIDSNAGTINLSAAPTAAQRAVLRQLIARNGGAVSVDFGNGWDSDHYAEYDEARPQRVLSDIDKYFDEGIKPVGDYGDGVRYHRAAPVFYSNAERAVEGIRQEKASPEQWLAMIQKAGGLKAGEDKWMGLSEWLKGQGKKTLTKDEVLAYIRANQVEVEEVTYADAVENTDFELLRQDYDEWLREEGQDYAWEQLRERFGDDADIAFDDMGGELTIANGEAAAALLGSERFINDTRLSYTTEGLENKREIALTVPTIEPWNEADEIHFGDAGEGRAVAWVRFGETRDSEGKRVLVIDEIQSKRHQEGREKGYKSEEPAWVYDPSIPIPERERYTARKVGRNWFVYKDGEIEAQMEASSADEAIAKYVQTGAVYEHKIDKRIPDAPFEKNWHELAMKRMLRYAAENGYDKVAWTKGAQQAERYGLGNKLDTVETYTINENDKKEKVVLLRGPETSIRLIVDYEGTIIQSNAKEYIQDGTPLDAVVGKELALKIMQTGEDSATFKGEDLMVGGAGMRGFYDQMLPRFMDKYGKKWGVKTHDVELPEVEEAGRRMHAVDVTDEMRASVTEGQPMFFRTEGGEAYGFTMGGKIYIDPRIASSETRVHEYAHLWAQALRRANPEAWAALKRRMLGDEHLVEYVRSLYPEITDEDVLMEEVFTHFSGRRGAERLRQERDRMMSENKDGVFGVARIVAMFDRLGRLLKDFWQRSRDLFAGRTDGLADTTGEDFADMMMADLMNRVDPRKEGRGERPNSVAVEGAEGGARPNSVAVAAQREAAHERVAREMEQEDIERVNERFNEDLQKQIDGTLPKGHVYDMGMPGDVLLSTGFPNIPIEMSASHLSEKAAAAHHPFGIEEVRDLVKAIQAPMAVFAYGDKDKAQNVIVEIQHEGKNFVVGIHFNQKRHGAVVSDIRGLYPKDNAEWLNWITQGKLIYADKEKIQTLIGKQRRTLAEVDYLDLNSAAKIVENFENPKLPERKNVGGGEKSLLREGETFAPKPTMARGEWRRLAGEREQIDRRIEEIYGEQLSLTGRDAAERARLRELDEELSGLSARREEIMSQLDGTVPEPTAHERRSRQSQARQAYRLAKETAREWVKRLRLEGVAAVYDSIDEVPGHERFSRRKRRAKGWFDPATGKIVIVLGNHGSVEDVVRTILHEAVAHYGLRQLFGKNFDHFLDNVWSGASADIRQSIADIMDRLREHDRRSGRTPRSDEEYRRTATEEYLAKLAEDTDFEGMSRTEGAYRFWQKVKEWFLDMLGRLGLRDFGGARPQDVITDGELRYILWRSYKSMTSPGEYRNTFDMAEDMAKRREMGVETDGTAPLIEESIPLTAGTSHDEQAVRKAVARLSLREARQAYSRLNDLMRDETGLDPDEQDEAITAEWRQSGRSFDLGKRKADLQRRLERDYGSLMTLRWELQDRIIQLGSDYLDPADRMQADLMAAEVGSLEKPVQRQLLEKVREQRDYISRLMARVVSSTESDDVRDPMYAVLEGKYEDLGDKAREMERALGDDALFRDPDETEGTDGELPDDGSEELSGDVAAEARERVEHAAGSEPQQRQVGAITDEQVDALNREVQRTMKSDRDMMRTTVQQMGEKLHTNINIIEDVNEITHPNAAVQERRRRSKGWYDTATGQVVIVLPNNRNIDDVKASVGHETIAHKGLRELVGEENYDEFLDETYQHLRDDLKKGVDDAAGKMFLAAMTSQHTGRTYERCRREAVDELFGRMAEKPFEEFSDGERTLWQRIKATVRRLLDKFLGSLKLPKWFELGDNELRYILWRSKERLERGREHPIDLARDIVKREELGLTDEARYNMGDVVEPSFAARRDRAVKEHGYVHPGLNSAEVKVVSIKEKSPFDTSKKTKALKEDVVAYANEHNIIGTMTEEETKGKGKVTISKASIEKMVDDSATGKSVDKDTHLAIIPQLREVIAESIMAETHPDYNKGKDGKRSPENGHSGNVLIHRCYGAINIDGMDYRVKITLKEDGSHKGAPHKAYTYEVTKIELLGSTDGEGVPSTSYTSNSESIPTRLQTSDDAQAVQREVYLSTAKLLQNVEKSHDLGKKLLEQSEIADESTDLYRDPDETEDIWKDRSLGLQERITAAATRLANYHREDKTLRSDAMRAICDNLADLAKSMLGHPRKKDLTDAERRSVNAKAGDAARAQKRFDQTTVKRVSDLARVLISSGHLNGLSAGKVKRLLSAVKNSAGHDDIEGDVQKVMDIMVDNQLEQGESTLRELEAIRGSKVDARGVEVQGELDLAGQVMMEAFKDGRRLKREALEEEIGKALDRMGSESESVREDAENAYAGLQFALQYAARISDNEHAEKVLRDELKKKRDVTSERDRMTDSYRQYVVSMEDAIRQKKIERAQAYHDLVAAMTGSLRESMANAKAFKESERKRVESIRHFANSDMQGMELRGQRPDSRLDRWNESWLLRLGLSPLHTFDQFMRLFGRKNADGKGYLYDHFVRKYIDSADHEQLMKEKYEGKLEAKVKELFGTHKVVGGLREVPYTYTSLYGYVDALPMTKVTYYDGAGKREYELSQAQLAYLYIVDKMPMGKATNRGMGVTEEVIEQIEGSLDAKLKEFADWVQEEFLVELGNECNEVHKRMFGANMDSIENYFPFVRDKNSIKREVENGAGESMAERISTKTGAIIKRTPSVANWDMPNANFLDVLAKHVSEMCQWSSYAELNRDLGTLQSFNRFKQQVLDMRTIYGSGEQLWKRFMQTCAIAGNAYEPKRGEADKWMVQGAKGVVMGKIAFRPMTAMKQLLSLPAFFGEVDMECLSRDFATGGIASVKWAWENMPNFRKRIKSRTAGDFRLSATKYDKEKGWTNTLMHISAYGMLPNIGVDAWTIALGSHAVYVKAKKKYLSQGYSEEKAERRAVQDAELCFNKSQQSSEGAFMAPVQIDHTFASTTMMLFRNSSTSYTRECVTSVRNLKRMMSGEVDVDFMAKQLLRNAEIPTFSMLFDAELQRQVEGTLPVGHIYSLGMPGGLLQSAGFPDAPIELSSTRLAEKSSDPGHPFPIEALKGLVDALNDPVAVFNYGNNAMNVIVGLEYKGKHFLVGVHFNQQHRGTSVSDIRVLFPKDNAEWLNWISQGKARYLDHKRIKALIAQQRINLAEVDYLDLKDVAKVMESFVNPSIPEQKYFAGWRAEDVERAREQARKEYRSGYIRNSVNAVMFGFILPWLWRIGGLSILLTLGDDDDDKVSEVKKASKQSLLGPLEGIAYGDVIADGLYVSANKLFGDGTEKFSNLGRTNPFLSDLADVLRKLDGDQMAAVNDVLNMLVGMKTGVNLQTVSDWATAILDYSPDGDTSREVSLLVSRLLNAPQSQIEKIYFDEIGMSGDEALRLSPRELVERYAQYKVKREHFVTPWVWGDEALLDKKRKRGKTIVKERTEQMGDKEVNESYDRHAEAFKEMDVRVKDLKKSIKEAGSDVERQMLLEDIQHYMAGDTGSFYGLFKTYDKGLGDLAKMYLSAKTPDEATLCRQAVLDYKAAMVKVLDAPDEDARAEAIGDLGNVMREFAEKYAPMQQPNR